MNRQESLILAATGLVCGGIGYFAGVLATKEKAKAEYEESARSYRRAMEMTREPVGEAPVDSEVDLEIDFGRTKPVVDHVEGVAITVELHDPVTAAYEPLTRNPYHATQQEIDKPRVEFSSEPNDAGISYIDEEEYLEEDGRFKGSVVIVMSAEEPTFFMDGTLVADWEHMLGASIVQDFIAMVPPGPNPILYVRNHNTDSDYELTPELP